MSFLENVGADANHVADDALHGISSGVKLRLDALDDEVRKAARGRAAVGGGVGHEFSPVCKYLAD